MIDYDYMTNRPSPVVPTNAKAEIQAEPPRVSWRVFYL